MASVLSLVGRGGASIAAINDPRNSYRSVYLPIIREQLPEALTLFDFPDPNSVAGERAISAVPAQSLYLMNNPFVIRQAEYAAERLLASSGTDTDKLKRAYETFYSRPPSEKEEQAAMHEGIAALDGRLTVLEEKVETRLYDTRPIWEAVQLQIKRLDQKFDIVIKDLSEVRVDTVLHDKRLNEIERRLNS